MRVLGTVKGVNELSQREGRVRSFAEDQKTGRPT